MSWRTITKSITQNLQNSLMTEKLKECEIWGALKDLLNGSNFTSGE
jgi:hypothetical protein